jgi:TRAP-type C4-dicarboxylate transport system substrate-binding protein
MRTNTRTRAASMTAILALVVAGCGGTGSDKAGGARQSKPTVLTMANGNGDSAELEPFAAAVARESGGTLRIEFKNHWRGGVPSYETGVIGDVKAGKADLAWAGSRAFDSVGVAAFDALHAPLLIDSYPLERKALESPLAGKMLEGLKPLGLVGVGILPGPMRKPLGVTRLVGPDDYAGKRLALSRSQVGAQALRTLGARGEEIPAMGGIEGTDGIEQQITSIDGNSYDRVGRYLTANVNLWPRPLVIFMGSKAFDGLNGRQRAALRAAARAAIPATLAADRADEKESTGNLCRRGLRFVTAGAADLAALRRALRPVYARLERDAPTRAAIEQIQAMRSEAAVTPDAAVGPGADASPTGGVSAIDGVYRVHTTPKELRAAGSGDALPENYGSYKWTLDRGHFGYTQKSDRASERASGTFTVTGNVVEFTIEKAAGVYPNGAGSQPGGQMSFRWSLYRDQLTLKPVRGAVSPENFRAKPWRRTGSVPAATGHAPSAVGKPTAIDGRYRVETTAKDLRAAGASASELIPENYGRYEIVLRRGRFTHGLRGGSRAVGSYTVAGHTLTMTFDGTVDGNASNLRGERFDYRWSRYRDQLTLEPVAGKVSPVPLRARPWRRIASAR